jgi:FdhD protein
MVCCQILIAEFLKSDGLHSTPDYALISHITILKPHILPFLVLYQLTSLPRLYSMTPEKEVLMDSRVLTEIRRIDAGSARWQSDVVIDEQLLRIEVNGQLLVHLACLPNELHALVCGFLLSEGIVKTPAQIQSVHLDLDAFTATVTADVQPRAAAHSGRMPVRYSGCGNAFAPLDEQDVGPWPTTAVSSSQLIDAMRTFRQSSRLFAQTGGVHSAALTAGADLLVRADDIGRHNAVDKVIGMAVMETIDLQACILLTSGRISAEIVSKIVRAGIPLICSPGAPTAAAIRLGWWYRRYLIGFARGQRFSLYTGLEQLGIQP